MREAAIFRRPRLGLTLAILTAVIGWAALAIEFHRSIDESLAKGRSVLEALFFYFRYFTILTNVGVASLMSVLAVRLLTTRPLPPARVFNAGLVYIFVTCVTYELVLRSQWTPRGMQFATDAVIHDVVPMLMFVFWLGFAPRAGTRWRDAFWMLVYPAGYLTMTLVAGALHEGYPYSFLNVDKLGLRTVLVVAAIFLAIFYGLGIVVTAFSMAWAKTNPKTDRVVFDSSKDDR